MSVAVPSLPTTTPLAWLASAEASTGVAPAQRGGRTLDDEGRKVHHALFRGTDGVRGCEAQHREAHQPSQWKAAWRLGCRPAPARASRVKLWAGDLSQPWPDRRWDHGCPRMRRRCGTG